VAKTFINRPASDIVDVGDAPVGGSGVGGMGSMFNQVFSPYLGKNRPKLQEKLFF
jgi:hypothetical protein